MSATLTVDFVLEGYRLSLRVEENSGAALLSKAAAIVAKVREAGGQPANGGNGAGDPWPAEKICPVHGAKMTLRSGKGGDRWYSHKAYRPDGSEFWCRGDDK